MTRTTERIPVLRPRLPSADRLAPYLERIDQSRIYTNFGPLASELETRLAEQFGGGDTRVTCAASGTAALAGAILSVAGRATGDAPLAVVPAFTFAATALAAELCGYQVHFCDVDPGTWQLDPAAISAMPDLQRVGLILPVAPFGRAVGQQAWLALRNETGIPVVIDAAASFEHLKRTPEKLIGEIPVALSFHATKSFSTGEGGCIVTGTRSPETPRMLQSLNFGFFDTRECEHPSLNGKMSEYHAAVGLAELDAWQSKEAGLVRAARRYRSCFSAAGLEIVAAPDVCSSYVLLVADSAAAAAEYEAELQGAGIGYRRWYQSSLNNQPYFRRPHAPVMPVSEDLSERLLGLPTAPDIEDEAIDEVVNVLQCVR